MKRTITCNSMDEMIDLASAYMRGGLSALREAIRHNDTKGHEMADKEYDNSNQVALWKRPDNAKGVYVGGNGDLDGVKIRTAMMATRDKRTEKGPVGDFFWVDEDGNAGYSPIFNRNNKLGGSTDTHWINVWKNDKDKGPAIKVFFNAKDAQPVAAGNQPVEQDDFVPF